jgi:hypothetical protein
VCICLIFRHRHSSSQHLTQKYTFGYLHLVFVVHYTIPSHFQSLKFAPTLFPLASVLLSSQQISPCATTTLKKITSKPRSQLHTHRWHCLTFSNSSFQNPNLTICNSHIPSSQSAQRISKFISSSPNYQSVPADSFNQRLVQDARSQDSNLASPNLS